MQAFVLLAELWAASEIILLTGPLRGDALLYACLGAFLVFCCALTYFVTSPRRSEPDSPITRHLLPVQLLVVLAVVVLSGWLLAAKAHALIDPPPVWTSIDSRLGLWLATVAPADLGKALLGFAEYVLVPLAILVLLRVPLGKMGLGAFSRGSLGAAAIWLLLPFLAVAYVLLYADVSAVLVGRKLIYSFFAAGFSEEFLFRGALFGRLRSFMPAQWAALAQALLFGLWRLGNNVEHAHALVPALALVVPAQAAFGYAMAILVRRTGNLAIPAILHTVIDAVRGSL